MCALGSKLSLDFWGLADHMDHPVVFHEELQTKAHSTYWKSKYLLSQKLFILVIDFWDELLFWSGIRIFIFSLQLFGYTSFAYLIICFKEMDNMGMLLCNLFCPVGKRRADRKLAARATCTWNPNWPPSVVKYAE